MNSAGHPEGAARSKREFKPKPRRGSSGVGEAAGNLFGILGGLLLVIIAAGAIFATNYFMVVLKEISSNDYSKPQKRIEVYSQYFEKLKVQGNDVRESEPFIREGEKYYLWRVIPPQASEGELYRWKINLQTNSVEALTSAAKKLDQALGFGTGDEIDSTDSGG